MNNPVCHPKNNSTKAWVKNPFFWVGVGVISLGFVVSLATIQGDWGFLVVGFCVFYTISMTLFFAAQVWGFVVSQTTYSDSVEAPKYTLLQLEESEWG